MQIIPVLDIKNNQVVQAIKGERSNYQPIQSSLCSSSNPLEITKTLINKTKAKVLYLADLDAIENKKNTPDNFRLIHLLSQQFPDQSFWVDAGFDSSDKLTLWKTIPNLKPVIGTESHSDISQLLKVLTSDSILSLDFKDGHLLGPKEILDQAQHWPNEIILMSLDSVGSNSGPNFSLMTRFQTLHSKKIFYAAGGVRDQKDLERLKDSATGGALIASALHNGKLTFEK